MIQRCHHFSRWPNDEANVAEASRHVRRAKCLAESCRFIYTDRKGQLRTATARLGIC